MTQTEPAVQDQLAPADPARVQLAGFLGRRCIANARERLPMVDEDELLAGFERRPGSHPWIGEHVGKWLTAACASVRATGDAGLHAKIERVATRLMASQEADGYLGTYRPADRFQLKPDADWDVWVHKYAILGLLAYHDLTRDEHALAVASRAADLLIKTFGPGGKSLITAGTHMGMAATSVLEPIVLLHRATGEPRYLDFARAIVNSYADPGGPDLLAKLLARTPVNRVANAKAYEMLSNLVGLAELHRATGERTYLEACLNAWGDIARHRIYPTGGASSHELFQPDDQLPRGTDASIAETCVTTTWIQLNAQLLRLTGEARFADEIERSAYNHLLAAQRPTGEAWCYYTPLEGTKPYGSETNCCLSSGPRAVALLPSLAVMTARDGARVNLYEPGRYQLASGTVLTIATAYPYEGVVELSASAPVRLGLRVPAFAAGKITLDLPYEMERGYALVDVRDRVRLTLPMDVALAPGRGPSAGRVFLSRGPLVFAASARLNPACPSIRLLALDPGTLALAPLEPARADFPGQCVLRGEGRCAFPLDREPAKIAVELTDFAHTGTRLDPFEVALLQDEGSISRFALAQESFSRPGNVNGHFQDEDATTHRVTWDGAAAERDWFALTLARPVEFDTVIYQHGSTHHDGGWFDASRGKPWIEIQSKPGGAWEKIATLDDYPATTATDAKGLRGGEAFSVTLPHAVRACAIRVLGHGACGDRPQQCFSSCAELRALRRGGA